MKQTINMYDFERAFIDMDRADNFSYEGKKALFEYLEEYEESCDTEIEFDVIALCCEYSEFENVKELFTQYFNLLDIDDYVDFDQTNETLWNIQKNEIAKYDLLDADAKEEFNSAFIDEVRDNTQVIEFDGGIIIQDF